MNFASPVSNLQFTFAVIGLTPNIFSVVKFDFIEEYNELYEVDIQLVSGTEHSLDFTTVLDNKAVFRIWKNGELQREVSGIVAYIEQGNSGFRRTFYRLKLVPALYRASLVYRSRIFQLQSIEDILTTILRDNRILHHAFYCRFPHPRREFCVQYRETDFEFMQRLAGEEGLSFHFVQIDGNEHIIFYDDNVFLIRNEAPILFYNANRDAQSQEETVTEFYYANQLRPNQVTLKDYTFHYPRWYAEFSADEKEHIQQNRYRYAHHDYPGRFRNSELGKLYANYRIDTLRRDANIGYAKSNCLSPTLGKTFQLENHPNEAFNTDWQPIRIHYHGKQSPALEEENNAQGTYLENRIDFIYHAQTYRANFPPKPRIFGTQTAVVVGPDGEEIFTDNNGRIRVKFHWDLLSEKADDHCSCWIRVGSPWAGFDMGFSAIPRVGQEVIVSFQNGDPDQPLIIGSTFNSIEKQPGNLPSSRTQMHLRSRTYKGRGYNGIMFEDATNQELFEMHAEKDMKTLVRSNQENYIRQNRTLTVDSAQTTVIGAGRTTTLKTGNDIKAILAGNAMEHIAQLKSTAAGEIFQYANEQIELEVGQKASITIDNDKILLRFGKSTILMNDEGIWLDYVHLGKRSAVHHNFLQNGVKAYSHSFILKDELGNIYRNTPYQIKNGDEIIKGISDEEGRTQTVYSHEEKGISVEIDWEYDLGK